ncbi:precursor of core protein 4b [Squirrelpox virus]|uniref:Virion core protein 4b n=1 Tax=Squirrelpox virus TaxID=240426 RepID=U3UBJ5_9POXV|nr:precursor of core protein 4b [Squirrelpox virus]CCD83274.1 precursor of core protein 4b [Squirrelpox virus]
MDNVVADMSTEEVFLKSKLGIALEYRNTGLDLVDRAHIHVAEPSSACGVCESLSRLANDDLVTAGARQQRPVRQPARRRATAREDPCKARVEEVKMIPIDEVASTQDWHLRLRNDGELVAKYMIEHKCDISTLTIQDLLDVMKRLNITRTDRNELFELLGHVKSSLSSSNLSVRSTHPLILIYSHANPRIGQQLRELDKVLSPSRHHTLLATTRFQSMHFVDMSSSQDLLFRFRDLESTYFVHPILMALFGTKLPALENTFINGDTYSMLQQLYEYRKVKPSNYMLLVNRLTEDTPIVIAGISDAISTEIQRANLHTMIRKVIMNIRMGIFFCRDDEAVDPHLMKIIHTNCSQVMTDEEQMLASVLSIVGFRPALVSIPRPGAAGAGFDMSLQSVPYIVVNPMNMITTSESPISINSSNVFSLMFDGASGRVMFSPPHMTYRGNLGCRGIEPLPTIQSCASAGRGANCPVIVNGVMIFYIERRQNRSVGGECFTGFRSIINDTPLDVAAEITINGIMYRLRSAVCYKIGDNFLENCGGSNDIFLNGHYSIIFTEAGPWMYDPLSVHSKSSRDARLLRALKNQYRAEAPGEDDSGFYDWLKGDGAAAAAAKQQLFMTHTAMFEDDVLSMDEAMAMISRQCCMLVYAQDYEPYVSSKTLADLYC